MSLNRFVCLGGMYYFEKVLSVGYGVRSHPLFCLHGRCLKEPGTAVTTTKTMAKTRSKSSSNNSIQPTNRKDNVELSEPLLMPNSSNGETKSYHTNDGGTGVDVIQERLRVESSDDHNLRVKILGLKKVFPGRGGAPEKVAVSPLFLGINKNECLGLLGPNGAGKTTAISMLCGLFEPTNGNAFVDNQSITNTKELQNIHTSMGVCPQHDVLWSDLTAREHLLFYGRLKGLTGGVLINEVVEVLKDVKLTFAADKQCGKYSGKLNERLIF
jgi:ABC-type glutathione transport system ATPase component